MQVMLAVLELEILIKRMEDGLVILYLGEFTAANKPQKNEGAGLEPVL